MAQPCPVQSQPVVQGAVPRIDQLIELTSRAHAVLENAKTEMSKVVVQAMAGISTSDQKTMVRALETMGMNLASRTPVGADLDVR